MIRPGRRPRLATPTLRRLVPTAVPITAMAPGTPASEAEPVISSTAIEESVAIAMYAVDDSATPVKRMPVSRRAEGSWVGVSVVGPAACCIRGSIAPDLQRRCTDSTARTAIIVATDDPIVQASGMGASGTVRNTLAPRGVYTTRRWMAAEAARAAISHRPGGETPRVVAHVEGVQQLGEHQRAEDHGLGPRRPGRTRTSPRNTAIAPREDRPGSSLIMFFPDGRHGGPRGPRAGCSPACRLPGPPEGVRHQVDPQQLDGRRAHRDARTGRSPPPYAPPTHWRQQVVDDVSEVGEQPPSSAIAATMLA